MHNFSGREFVQEGYLLSGQQYLISLSCRHLLRMQHHLTCPPNRMWPGQLVLVRATNLSKFWDSLTSPYEVKNKTHPNFYELAQPLTGKTVSRYNLTGLRVYRTPLTQV
ncbi:hypothetical protein PR048_014341 [Dryococelus australis]|uniref:Uncharacterized protein n=1 Tax=Dryococelus australis TaxID=614101 RepID=A0ABQ9HE37_9NEOP|nr:hypothetical protein PR048_014341 [Dryococelus australis]